LAASTSSLFLGWLAREVGRGCADVALRADGGRQVGIVLDDAATKRFAFGYDAKSGRPYLGAQIRDFEAVTEILWTRAQVVAVPSGGRGHEIALVADGVAFATAPGRMFSKTSLRLAMKVGGCSVSRWLGSEPQWIDIRRIDVVDGSPHLVRLEEAPLSLAIDIIYACEPPGAGRSR
jgi:hypothetical protein